MVLLGAVGTLVLIDWVSTSCSSRLWIRVTVWSHCRREEQTPLHIMKYEVLLNGINKCSTKPKGFFGLSHSAFFMHKFHTMARPYPHKRKSACSSVCKERSISNLGNREHQVIIYTVQHLSTRSEVLLRVDSCFECVCSNAWWIYRENGQFYIHYRAEPATVFLCPIVWVTICSTLYVALFRSHHW